ncbi:oligopeptide/dipeptide transporter, C-terminal region family protein [Candidatus Phytoplasma oryzae]|nr:hypothetical protein [Candidatus Phytoplasma oryzae]KXT29027.1 oligopeptide/dipeptide transporter, C-terminal region family protein [Candidatus Phytoplasma oryzae]
MYKGHLVELANKEEIFQNPLHFYTRKMLRAIPKMNDNYIDNNMNNQKEEDQQQIIKEEKHFEQNEEKLMFQKIKKGHFVLK